MAGVKDSLFGSLAVQWGFCSEKEIEECLAVQHEMEAAGRKVPRLGELLAHKGYMTPDQVRAVLDGQHRKAEGLFGEIAVRWRLCTQANVDECLRTQKERDDAGGKHARVGELLYAGGFIKKPQVRAILQAQRKGIAVCKGCGKRFNVAGFEYGAKLRCSHCGTVTILREEPAEAKPEPDDAIEVDATVFIPAKDLPVREEPRLEIGGYEVYSRLGSDATGTICKARHAQSGAAVALKIMGSSVMQDAAFLNRFVEDGKKATTLDHPALKKVYEVGVDQGRYFYSTEFVEGASIRKILESGRIFTPVQALDVAIQLAEALDYAHKRGVIHGDLRPSCVIITVDGRVKIDGMGMAKDVAGNLKKLSAGGEQLPLYLAPELAVDPDRATPQSDVYSLGATLYHMLTGSPPYKGESPLEVLMMVSETTPKRVSDLNREVPEYVGGIIERMLSPEAADRQESAAELLLELRASYDKLKREAAHGEHGTPARALEPVATIARGTHEVQPTVRGVSPVTGTVRGRIEQRERSSHAVLLVIAVALISVGAAAGYLAFFKKDAPEQPRQAQVEPRGQAPQARSDPAAIEAERKVREAYEALLAYRNAHPGEAEAVYARYKQFLSEHGSSPAGKSCIDMAAAAAKDLFVRASEEAYRKLREGALELGKAMQYRKAVDQTKAFIDAYGQAETASSAKRLLQQLQESQSDSYRSAMEKAEGLIAQQKPDEAKEMLRRIVDGFTEQFADPARRRLAEVEAAAAPATPAKEASPTGRPAAGEEAAQQALSTLKTQVAAELKAFSFEKAASLAATAAAAHGGAAAAKEMKLVEADVESVRELIKAFAGRITSGEAKAVVVKYSGSRQTVYAATEQDIALRDARSGMSLRVPWPKIEDEELLPLLSGLVNKESGPENLALATFFHYRGDRGWASVAASRAKRLNADVARLERLMDEARAESAKGPESGTEAGDAPESVLVSFNAPMDLDRFEKASGTWQVTGGAAVGRGDPSCVRVFMEGLTELSARARFEKLDGVATFAAGDWSITLKLKDQKAVFSAGGNSRREIDFAPAANVWYDWTIRLEREGVQAGKVVFLRDRQEQAAFGSGRPQAGAVSLSADKVGGFWLDNVFIKGKLTTGTAVDRALGRKRVEDAGWQIVEGDWSMDQAGVITGRSVGGKPAEISRSASKPFHAAVSVKSGGQFCGFSFGKLKDFGTDGAGRWQRLRLKVQQPATLEFSVDGQVQWGSGDHTGVRTPSDLGDVIILKCEGTAEFKDYDVVPLN